MPYTDLREWITKLDKAGELRRIREAVSPHLEMAEIADRTAKLHKGTLPRRAAQLSSSRTSLATPAPRS